MADAVKAYRQVAAEPEVKLEFTTRLGEVFAEDTGAVVNAAAKTITTSVTGDTRFYRLRGGQAYTLKRPQIQGANLVLTYE
ncbi:MAG: hypothetical protein M5U12_18995 [Verrucomicrobia bacterium]|nr:hypothetical protein [Verrucomicrobiota bacterium]